MGVDVISSQDCLHDSGFHQHRSLVSPPRSKPRRIPGNRNPNPVQTRSSRRKQWSPSGSPPPPSQSKPKSPDSPSQVRILKRGEELTPLAKLSTSGDPTPVKDSKTKRSGSIDRADSDPVALTTILAPVSTPAPSPIPFIGGFYAGAAFVTSPPPSSLPVPCFCKSDDSNTLADATVGLLRILKIDFSVDFD